MSANIFLSMTVQRKPNWIATAALHDNGIVTEESLSFNGVTPALTALRRGKIKQAPQFVVIDELSANRAPRSVAHLTHALIELGSHVFIVAHDEGEIGQLNRISFNHGVEPVLDTNLSARLAGKIESL